MYYTITKMNNKLSGETGYAFIDKDGHCIIVVYGFRNMINMKSWLNA